MKLRTVLIVEDEADFASMLEVAMEGLPGITSIRVPSAEAAIEQLKKIEIAALISDVNLPAMSGIELIPWAKGVPVLIMSASTDAGVKQAALRAGATAFFAKPFSPAAVCEKVQELLKESTDA